MKMKRRYLLGGGLASVVLLSTGVRIFSSDMTGGIVSFIRRSFPGLDMSEEDLTSFASDMGDSWNMSGTKKTFFASMLNNREQAMMGSVIVPDRLDRAHGEIVAMFLRSTDYLAPERTASVIYLGLADPYASGCSNPVPAWTSTEAAWPTNIG